MEMELTRHNGLKEVEPDIDKQIEYVRNVRTNVVKHIKPLQSEMRMIMAIEQTLIAAKWLAWPCREQKNSDKVTPNDTRTVKTGASKKREKN